MTTQGTEARRGETEGFDAKRDGPVGAADAPQPTDNREIPVTTSEQQAVPVAQEDREFAARWIVIAPENAQKIRAGKWDRHEGVKAAARHRLASLPCKSGEGAEEDVHRCDCGERFVTGDELNWHKQHRCKDTDAVTHPSENEQRAYRLGFLRAKNPDGWEDQDDITQGDAVFDGQMEADIMADYPIAWDSKWELPKAIDPERWQPIEKFDRYKHPSLDLYDPAHDHEYGASWDGYWDDADGSDHPETGGSWVAAVWCNSCSDWHATRIKPTHARLRPTAPQSALTPDATQTREAELAERLVTVATLLKWFQDHEHAEVSDAKEAWDELSEVLAALNARGGA